MLITGLTAVNDLRARPDPGGIVLWTSGEANRRLHLLYAEEELKIRAYCSKSSGTGKADVLNAAILAAAAGRPYVDPVLSAYLPSSHSHPISQTIFRDEKHRAIWRAIALGAHSREEIAELTGHPRRTIGNLMPDLLVQLLTLDPGIQAGKPLNEIVRYANRNWEFFLDDAVRARFP
jgi:DNA-binding NarL/FixJ family response regulator